MLYIPLEITRPPKRTYYLLTNSRKIKKLIIGIVGSTIILFGIILLVLPGPGIPTIVSGMAILATEFAWARLLMRKAKRRAKRSVPAWLKRSEVNKG